MSNLTSPAIQCFMTLDGIYLLSRYWGANHSPDLLSRCHCKLQWSSHERWDQNLPIWEQPASTGDQSYQILVQIDQGLTHASLFTHFAIVYHIRWSLWWIDLQRVSHVCALPNQFLSEKHRLLCWHLDQNFEISVWQHYGLKMLCLIFLVWVLSRQYHHSLTHIIRNSSILLPVAAAKMSSNKCGI